MKFKSRFSISVFLAVGFSASAYAAQKFETSTVLMECGEAKFKIESTCAKSAEEMTLNVCKPQKLTIVVNGDAVQKQLPEFSKFSLKILKEVGGDPKNLYVVSWGCGGKGSEAVASLYYSIGGGSAPYSESMGFYDSKGRLIEQEKDVRYKKSMSEADGKMKPVPSIMPD